MSKKKSLRTLFLCTDNNFIIGMGSVLNVAGNYFEFATSRDALSADLKALASDWEMIGNDIGLTFESECKKIQDKNKDLIHEEICN